jgi:hypothetical protein
MNDMEASGQKRGLDEETSSRVDFYALIITKFAHTYRMNRQQTYLYLKEFGGLDFLYDCWWALHTDNPDWAVHDINRVCLQNGVTQ